MQIGEVHFKRNLKKKIASLGLLKDFQAEDENLQAVLSTLIGQEMSRFGVAKPPLFCSLMDRWLPSILLKAPLCHKEPVKGEKYF